MATLHLIAGCRVWGRPHTPRRYGRCDASWSVGRLVDHGVRQMRIAVVGHEEHTRRVLACHALICNTCLRVTPALS